MIIFDKHSSGSNADAEEEICSPQTLVKESYVFSFKHHSLKFSQPRLEIWPHVIAAINYVNVHF